MHKQTGYQFTNVDLGTERLFIGVLHGTNVLTYSPKRNAIKFNTGGWVTRSTVKAMQGALRDANLSHLEIGVRMSKGHVFVSFQDKEFPFTNTLEINL